MQKPSTGTIVLVQFFVRHPANDNGPPSGADTVGILERHFFRAGERDRMASAQGQAA